MGSWLFGPWGDASGISVLVSGVVVGPAKYSWLETCGGVSITGGNVEVGGGDSDSMIGVAGV